MLYLFLTVQGVGAITLYYWFFFNSQFFYLLNKHKNANPLYLFFLPLGFIAYPAIFALAYKLAWDFFDDGVLINAFLVTSLPGIFFLLGVAILRRIKSL